MSTNQGISLDQFRQVFFDECAERLDELRETLDQCQESGTDNEALHAIFRAVHSIKAGAGAFKFVRLVEFSHKFENLLDILRDGTGEVSGEILEVLVKGADALGDLVTASQQGKELAPGYEEGVTNEIAALIVSFEGDAAPADETDPESEVEDEVRAKRTIRISFKPNQDLFRHANEPLLMIRELRRLGELVVETDVTQLPDLSSFDSDTCYLSWELSLTTDAPLAEVQDVFEFVIDESKIEFIEGDAAQSMDDESVECPEPAEKSAKDESVPSPSTGEKVGETSERFAAPGQMRVSSIRVDLDRVDRLVNMVGELVIAQSMVLQGITENTSEILLNHLTGIDDLMQRTRELQEGVMAIRMQPVKSIFMRMPRVVRETAPKLGKKVNLVTIGESTEVDKTIIEELSDPLTHMIRNAVDHGLESPEERVAAGKPETGTIRLTAEHRGGRILISVADDGGGINLKKVRARAIDKGILEPDAEVSDHDLRQVILAPGFSTADKISDVSGRGVGMDVVRRKVQGLGGRISVDSTEGKGTTITLALPLTLAVLDGMLVTVADEKYVVPLTNIVETLRPERSQLRQLADGREILSIRGAFVPLIHLGHAFRVENAIGSADQGLVVLVESEMGSRFGLVVDELLGQQQVVIKNLEEHFRSVPGVAGATILGNGRVALILDVDVLCSLCGPVPRGSLKNKNNPPLDETDIAAEDKQSITEAA